MAKKSDNFFKGFVVGGLFGVVAGMLLAPKSGRELREDLQEESEKFWDRAKEDLQNAQEAAIHTYETSKGRVLDQMMGKKGSTDNPEESVETPETHQESSEPAVSAEEKPKSKRGRPKKKKTEK